MKRKVPVLLTWDVDPTPEVTVAGKKTALDITAKLLKELNIKSTFLFVATIAQQLKDEVAMLISNGHEIGSHGLAHSDEEEYNKMPRDKQREYLYKAHGILEAITFKPVTTFRGPRVKTSHITHELLEEMGYNADCSISSQRCDLVSSNLINIGWLFAPRLPYHPAKDSAFRRGNRKIWVVPISALILPFISSVLYTFRLKFMMKFFDILYKESLNTGKPIVYLAHPVEFAEDTIKFQKKISWFNGIFAHGFTSRAKLYLKGCQKRLEINKRLFQYIRAHEGVEFLTVNEFVSSLGAG